jgi:hypothetical protein
LSFCFPTLNAQYVGRICNKGNTDVWVSVTYYRSALLPPDWFDDAAGWTQIRHDDCQRLFDKRNEGVAYIGMTYVDRRGIYALALTRLVQRKLLQRILPAPAPATPGKDIPGGTAGHQTLCTGVRPTVLVGCGAAGRWGICQVPAISDHAP